MLIGHKYITKNNIYPESTMEISVLRHFEVLDHISLNKTYRGKKFLHVWSQRKVDLKFFWHTFCDSPSYIWILLIKNSISIKIILDVTFCTIKNSVTVIVKCVRQDIEEVYSIYFIKFMPLFLTLWKIVRLYEYYFLWDPRSLRSLVVEVKDLEVSFVIHELWICDLEHIDGCNYRSRSNIFNVRE